MAAIQPLLFPDPQPLVDRLGRDFFRQLPQTAGVYLMRDANDTVLYIGKAKNLRQRLAHYRTANPDRMPRRHLRLLRKVARIELQSCPDEAAALARESELLREIRPRFNRAGTWSSPPRYFAWYHCDDRVHLTVTEKCERPWIVCGPVGIRAVLLRAVLARLLWIATHPEQGFTGLPLGWFQGAFEATTEIACGPRIEAAAVPLGLLADDNATALGEWFRAQLLPVLHPFEESLVQLHLELLADALS
jgi:predicted GIY-YIG superfamily endonuclease